MLDRPSAAGYQAGDPRLMILWAKRYAKSRTISFLVQWVFIMGMVLVIATAASLTQLAHTSGNTALFALAIATMGLAILVLAWFSVSAWGGELIWKITQWLYGTEGYVAVSGERDHQPTPWWLTALGGGLVIYHLVGAILVGFGHLRLDFMQPYSALYMTPFLITLIVYQQLGFWAWIWPLLYALHALLLIAGINPLPLRGEWVLFHLVLPVFGYGLLAILSGHAYSRFALWKLKRLARSGLPEDPLSDDDINGDAV